MVIQHLDGKDIDNLENTEIQLINLGMPVLEVYVMKFLAPVFPPKRGDEVPGTSVPPKVW